jgi:predicted nucleic acid-binding protein
MAAIVLDSGAVIGLARGDREIATLIEQALVKGVAVLMPPVVVTQTIRGGGRDAPIHQLLQRGCNVPATDLRVARRAGELLGATGASDAADAQVAAHCLDAAPATLITSDPDDMRTLLAAYPTVRIRGI